jgi:alkanesulfonate monooxygenase SsuD/methylene tetrahydromethanopterin reductase-like flavin-dependent oxidoreductase (luciferase family)
VFAAQYGLPFAQSMFHFPNTTLAALATYCRDFRPSTWAPEPRTMVAIAGVCAETRARAQAIAASQPNKAITLNVVGTAADWCDYVAEMVSIAGVHEVMYFEASPLPAQRLRAYELLAGALAETSPRAAGTLGRPVDTMHSYSTQA